MNTRSPQRPTLNNPIPPLSGNRANSATPQKPVSSQPPQSTVENEYIEELKFRQCLIALGFVGILAILTLIAILRMHGFSYGQV